ncbi:hypothetical protein MXB_1033 [Myxobolus squamalis]|nr:hypothetical protein MXB_1033 [Myxobolus squamalis]
MWEMHNFSNSKDLEFKIRSEIPMQKILKRKMSSSQEKWANDAFENMYPEDYCSRLDISESSSDEDIDINSTLLHFMSQRDIETYKRMKDKKKPYRP